MAAFCGVSGPFWTLFTRGLIKGAFGEWDDLIVMPSALPIAELIGFPIAFLIGLIFSLIVCVLSAGGLNRAWFRLTLGVVLASTLLMGVFQIDPRGTTIGRPYTESWAPWEVTTLGVIQLVMPCFLTILPIRNRWMAHLFNSYG